MISSIDHGIGGGNAYGQYQDDPVGFGEDVLGEAYTNEIETLMNSVRDHVITVAISSNAVGKTHAAARIGVWFYKVFLDSQVFTGAAPPESNLKKLLWGEIGSLTEEHADLFKTDNTKSLHIERSAQSFITGVTIPLSGTEAQREAKFSGKHAPHLMFIIDEGDAVPDEVYRGIESCISGGHARLLIMFNPRAEVNRETTVRRINEWCRPLTDDEQPDSECFELPRFLEGAVAKSQSGKEYPALIPGFYKIMEPAFSYMVLGQYPAKGSNQLISKEWIARARDRWDNYVKANGETPPKYTYGVMGLDIGEFGADSNVACCRYGGFIERLIAWGGIDTVSTGDRALREYQSRRISNVNVDATGIGAGVAPHLQRKGCSASAVKVASSPTETTELGEFYILRDQLWWACREWLRSDPEAMLPPDEQLLEELATPTYDIVNGKIRVMRKDLMRELLKRSPDRADALCLTFYKGGFFAGHDLT